MNTISIEINENEAALIDAALSLLHQNMVSQIGAIKESIKEFGEKPEELELLESATGLKQDIENLFTRLEQTDDSEKQQAKLKKVKRLKRG